MTGAAGGIGRATAATLAARGARVLATDRDGAPLLPLQRLLGAESFAADLSRAGDVDALLAWAGDRVDVLVNNAGFGRYERLPDVEAARTAELLSVDLEAPIRLTAGLMAPMVRRGSGHIVNVASIAGWVGVAREAVYSAAKGGLIAFSESLRYELAGTGVGVIVVVPAAVATGFLEASGRAYARRLPRQVDAARVAEALARVIERDEADVFVPRWLVVPVRLRGAAPSLFRRLAARSASR